MGFNSAFKGLIAFFKPLGFGEDMQVFRENLIKASACSCCPNYFYIVASIIIFNCEYLVILNVYCC